VKSSFVDVGHELQARASEGVEKQL